MVLFLFWPLIQSCKIYNHCPDSTSCFHQLLIPDSLLSDGQHEKLKNRIKIQISFGFNSTAGSMLSNTESLTFKNCI
jgi:hypothetical protein